MTGEAENAPDNRFWNFSLAFYARPGVADICIALQDKHRVDVNVLLYMLWLAANGISVSPSDVVAIDRRVKTWRDNVVAPLRNIRRSIAKSGTADARTEFRTRVKKLELDAERIEQDDLFSLFPVPAAAKPDTAAAQKNLQNYAAYLGCSFDSEIEKLLAAMAAPAQS